MRNASPPAVVESAEPLTPHSEAVLEAGRRLVLESVEVGRDFCKSMVGVSLTAIPAYVGLLKLFLPSDASPAKVAGLVWVIPVGLFLLAAAVSVGGHLPGRRSVSLELLEEVEATLAHAISRRFWCGAVAFVAFAIGIVVGIGILSGL